MLYSHLQNDPGHCFLECPREGNLQTVKRVLPQIKYVDIANEKDCTGLIMAVFNDN